MSRITLIRPGCTEFDEQERLQGTLDLPLSPRGEQQMQRLLAELAEIEIDLIYASPCEPARSTAVRLGELRGVPVKEIANLHNINLGLWQGLQLEEIRRKHPRVFKQWQEAQEEICPPAGESLAEAVERVRKALEKPLKKKGRLALVASDPLATIIGAVIRGTPLEGNASTTRGACGSWEMVESVSDATAAGGARAARLAATRPQ